MGEDLGTHVECTRNSLLLVFENLRDLPLFQVIEAGVEGKTDVAVDAESVVNVAYRVVELPQEFRVLARE